MGFTNRIIGPVSVNCMKVEGIENAQDIESGRVLRLKSLINEKENNRVFQTTQAKEGQPYPSGIKKGSLEAKEPHEGIIVSILPSYMTRTFNLEYSILITI